MGTNADLKTHQQDVVLDMMIPRIAMDTMIPRKIKLVTPASTNHVNRNHRVKTRNSALLASKRGYKMVNFQ